MDVMQTLKDWAGLFNVLLLPGIVYIVRIENKLTRIMALFGAHEGADNEKFAAIFRRLEYLERRNGRRVADVPEGG
jgi:hypothetical protein